MKNVKTLTAAILLGMGLLVGGCGNIDTTAIDNNTKQTQEQQIKWLDDTNSDKPDLRVGDKIRFNVDKTQPKAQACTMVNGRKMLQLTYAGDHGMTTYLADVTDIPSGVEAALVVDQVMVNVQDAQNLKLAGLYTGKCDKVVVTTVIGHAKEVK